MNLLRALVLLLICAAAHAQQSENRIALVIGNSAYQSVPLKNPVNDSRDMANKLRGLGFTVVERSNLTVKQIGSTLREFRSKLTPGSVALVFYAGHGLQIKGENYLPAVDADIHGEEDVPTQSLATRQIMDILGDAKTRLNLVFLDACRDNPFARGFRSASRGLSKESAPSGTLISFATRPGSVASDGEGKNGLYTGALLQAMGNTSIPIEQLLKKVVSSVKIASNSQQEPWMEGSIEGDFCFERCTVAQVALSDDRAFWDSVKDSKDHQEIKTYLNKFPGGLFAELAGYRLKALEAAGSQAEKEKAEATRQANLLELAAEAKRLADARIQAEEQRLATQVKKAATERAAAETAQREEAGRLAAEFKKLAEERAAAELAQKSEAVRLAAEFKRLGDERARVDEERLAAQTIKATNERIGASPQAIALAAGSQLIRDCNDCPEMVLLPAGLFSMGSERYADERPPHTVRLPRFLMGKTEVTQALWGSVMGDNPSRHNDCGSICPVENVSWNDVQDFIKRLNQKTGQNYRLPSEAEWEYAARAGSVGDWSFGNDESKLTEYAWYIANSQRTTHPTGSKNSNAFGLHDMHGNVWEWVADCSHPNYSGAPADGTAWVSNCSEDRVRRGGSWYLIPASLRSALREKSPADYRDNNGGFRLARSLTTDELKYFGEPDAPKADVSPSLPVHISLDMVVIPAGEYVMGSQKTGFLFGPEQHADEKPAHLVNVPSFMMGKTEVTQGQWRLVMGVNPSRFYSCGDNCPVENVSWDDAQAFLRKLNEITGKKYRLPSESEWEYAARAGTKTEWGFGDNEALLGEHAWYFVNSQNTIHPVAGKRPNAFGLHDLHGNVWEWVEDCSHAKYIGAPKDGGPWTTNCSANYRVLRGGSWNDGPASLRSPNRSGNFPDTRIYNVGFRLALSL